jgi:ligand-binding sensor domain-containing protein
VINEDKIIDYTMNDGLIYDRVDAIAQDKDGVMWFATQYGVSAFDGTKWENFTADNGLSESWITAISVDETGKIWFGTKTKGLSVYTKP